MLSDDIIKAQAALGDNDAGDSNSVLMDLQNQLNAAVDAGDAGVAHQVLAFGNFVSDYAAKKKNALLAPLDKAQQALDVVTQTLDKAKQTLANARIVVAASDAPDKDAQLAAIDEVISNG